MGYVIIACVFFFVGYKLGRKYQDFSDLMLAKRIAKMVEASNAVAKDKEDYERWKRQDEKIGKHMTREEKEND